MIVFSCVGRTGSNYADKKSPGNRGTTSKKGRIT